MAAERDPEGAAPRPADAEPEGNAEAAAAELEADLARLAAERDEMRALAQQVQADFENFRKRMLREQTDAIARANEQLVEALLPVLDSFELALGSLEDAPAPVRKGVELVYAELLGTLEKEGLERIDAEGRPFDPTEHEAVMHDEGGGAHPQVIDVMRAGYRFKGRVLRPVMVRVGHAPHGAPGSGESGEERAEDAGAPEDAGDDGPDHDGG